MGWSSGGGSGSGGGSTPPRGYVRGFYAQAGTFVFNWDAIDIVVENSSGDLIHLEDVDETANFLVSGAGGLDTGSEESSRWYYVWCIYNSATETINTIFSREDAIGDVTLPEGYDYFRLVASFYNDSSGDMVSYYQEGNVVKFVEPQQFFTATTLTSSYASKSFPAAVPSGCRHIKGVSGCTDKATGTFQQMRGGGHGDLQVTKLFSFTGSLANSLTGMELEEHWFFDILVTIVSTAAMDVRSPLGTSVDDQAAYITGYEIGYLDGVLP